MLHNAYVVPENGPWSHTSETVGVSFPYFVPAGNFILTSLSRQYISQ